MPETLQLLTYEYVEDMAERRTPYRAGHLAAIEEAREAGTIVIAGAAGDPPHTGLLAFRGDSPAVAETFAEQDPYVVAGLVVKRTIQPWTVVTPLP